MWTREEAIELCAQIEAICPEYGCHVALTGGCLYKTGERKDLDLVFYRIRQVPDIDKQPLFERLKSLGIEMQQGFGFVHKAKWRDRCIDFLFPEEDGVYQPPPPSEPVLAELITANNAQTF